MNVLQINTQDKGGGAANVAWSIKKELEKIGHIASMFVLEKRSNDRNVFRLPRTMHRYFHYLLANDIELFRSDRILKTKEFKDADIIHCHNLHGWYFSLKTLQKMSQIKPVVWTLHDMWAITPHCAYGLENKIKNGFYQCSTLKEYPILYWDNERYLCKKKEEIYKESKLNLVVPSNWLLEKVKLSVLKEKPIKLINNGIDNNTFKIFSKNSARTVLKLPWDKKIALFLADGGRNNKRKGWKYVEQIIKRYKDIRDIVFLCVGDEKYVAAEMVKEPNIIFYPRVNDNEILSKIYSASDVLIFPSLAENFSLVVLESLSCGLPVVAFEIGGNKESITHKETGYLAEFGNTDDMIRGMEFFLGQGDEACEKIAKNCINRINNNFTTDIMFSKYLELYESLLKRS